MKTQLLLSANGSQGKTAVRLYWIDPWALAIGLFPVPLIFPMFSSARIFRLLLPLVSTFSFIPMVSGSSESLPAPSGLTVGPLLSNPLGYGEAKPQFSWVLPSGIDGLYQSEYQIVCGTSEALLPENPDLWNSGWVQSGQSLFVDYSGRPVVSRERVYWKIRYKSDQGVSEWSEAAWFEMSLLEASDWEAQWIFLPEDDPEETAPCPYLRREFEVEEGIASARMYASARGVFELSLNGQRVGADYFQPEWTDYSRRSHFATYDVTGLLKAGENCIGAILGETWYAGVMGLGTASNQYGKTPELLLQLEIVYADGSKQILGTDESWKGRTGPIVHSNVYNGEDYDARLELGDWCTSGHEDGSWVPVGALPIDGSIILEPKPNQPIRIAKELVPASVSRIEPGKAIFDLGQNMVGWARISVPGEKGRQYTLRFAEMLEEDGSLYTENYRAAKSTDTYICADDSEVIWAPRFTFHGFRYVELSGIPEEIEPGVDWVTGVVLHNDMPATGSFTSSSPTLNRLQSNIQWGQRGNFFAVPTDCPQRDERLGWTGDAQVFCATANYNFNTLAFFVKWCADLRDSQQSNGSIPLFVPSFPGWRERSSSAWGDAAVIVPWEVYRSFGYERILEDNFQMMCEWVRFYEEHEKTEGWIHRGFSFGDWLQPYTRSEKFDGRMGETDDGLIGTAYFAYCSYLVSLAAEVLSRPEESKHYREKFEKIRAAFQTEFFDDEGRMTTQYETQTGYLLALGFDLIEEDLKPKALDFLIQHIREEAGGHLRTGFLGTPLIAPVLSRFENTPLAYEILFRETYPGWFYSIAQGATTMWERWNSYSREDGFGAASMNSFNHYAYGAIGEWMYESVAGLSAVEPGYRTIRFRPLPGPQLSMAEATLNTPYGPAKSRWERHGELFSYEVVLPPNTRGDVILPDGVSREVAPGTYRFEFEVPK